MGYELIGRKFCRLTVVRQVTGRNSRRRWLCACRCGGSHVVSSTDLIKGLVRSCGCLKDESSRRSKNKTHGLSKTNLYHVHRQMIKRCTDSSHKDFHLYGGRGISVCKEWFDITAFTEWAARSGYAKGLSIERVNVNGHYEPSNCCFIPHADQAQNTRRVRRLKFKGRSLTASEWARELNISVSTIIGRLNRGWSVARTLKLKPVHGRNQFNGPS